MRHDLWFAGYLDMDRVLRSTGKTYIARLHYNFFVDRTFNAAQLSLLHLSAKVTKIGDSTFETVSSLQSGVKNEVLIDNTVNWVYVKDGHRTPLPSWFKDRFGVDVPPQPSRPRRWERQLGVTDRSKLAEKCFPILPEHIDHFGHTNHTCYLSFIVKTLMSNSCELATDGDSVTLSSLEIQYRGESNVGDRLSVLAERDPGGSAILASITKDDSKVVVSCQFDLHPLPSEFNSSL